MKFKNLKVLFCLIVLIIQFLTYSSSIEMKLKRKRNKAKSDWSSVLTKLETFKPIYQGYRTTSCHATFLYLMNIFTDVGLFDLVKTQISQNKNLTALQKFRNLVSCIPCLGGIRVDTKKTTTELFSEAKTYLDNGKIIGVYLQAGAVQNHFQFIFKSGTRLILLQSFQDIFDLYTWIAKGRFELEWNAYVSNFENMLANGKTNEQKRTNLFDFAFSGDITKDILDGKSMKEKSDSWWSDHHLNGGLNLQLYHFTPNWAKIPTEDEIRELLK